MSAVWVSIASILTIAFLEIFLSLDNAIVLALIARELKPSEQKKALAYGLFGAVILRLAAVGVATELIAYPWIKIIGGVYLAYLVIRFFLAPHPKKKTTKSSQSFWMTVFWIEVTDLAFAVDSILAAVAMTRNYWIVVAGGLMGVVVIRFSAQGMIKLLERYPKIESIAYLFIAGVALKTLYEGIHSFW
jgi:YkoY family integral membrane protein